MDAMIEALSSAKSAEDVETAISATLDLNCSGDRSTFDAMKDNLKNVLEKVAEDPVLATTAKLRRRIKRFQQSLDAEPEAPVVEAKAKFSYPEPVVVLHLSPQESVAALVACRSYHDLSREMNNLYIPSPEEGGVKAESFSAYRIPMKDILKAHVAKDGMTNKLLRRRVTRLIFQLSTDSEQAEEVASVKAKALMAATRNLTAKKEKAPFVARENKIVSPLSNPLSTPAVIPVLSKFESAKIITECISGIRSAKSPDDIERVISALPAGGFGDSETLRDLLTTVMGNIELVPNAKVRRRVKRLIDTLQESSVSASAEAADTVFKKEHDNTTAASSSSGRNDIRNEAARTKGVQGTQAYQLQQKEKAPPLRIPSVTPFVPVPPPAPEVRVITGSFSDTLLLLDSADNNTLIEEAIADLSVDSVGSEEDREAVRSKLEIFFKNEALMNNSKLRRRVKRLIEVLAPPGSLAEALDIAIAASEEQKEPVKKEKKEKKEVVKKEKVIKEKKEDLRNPPPGPSLDSVINIAFTMRSSDELSSALGEVTAEHGDCGSRRTLKRVLDRVLKDDSQLSGQMTAQTRRKFRKYSDMMAPRPQPARTAPVATATAGDGVAGVAGAVIKCEQSDVAMTFL